MDLSKFLNPIFLSFIIFQDLTSLTRNKLVSDDVKTAIAKKLTSFSKSVAMYTPYALVPGGGERYFLSTALAFQNIGFAVDIMVNDKNPCKRLSTLKDLIRQLRIPLKLTKLKVIVVRTENYSIKYPKIYPSYYSAFYLLGNEKFPQLKGIGSHLNIYMCQFPFDASSPGSEALYNNLVTYQYVMVNSQYTKTWYLRYIYPSFADIHNRTEYLAFPAVVVVYPPVQPFLLPFATPFGIGVGEPPVKFQKNHTILSMKSKFHIVMLGRFFPGRQNKGHKTAIQIIEKLVSSIPHVHLTMIGNVHPNKASKLYVQELKDLVKSKFLPVSFATNASPKVIEWHLRNSLVVWHLTGIEQSDVVYQKKLTPLFGVQKEDELEDPASYEHFGIALVEAMNSGCIPIALNKGGVTEIIRDKVNGYLVGNSREVASKTIKIARLDKKDVMEFSQRVVNQAKGFSLDKFLLRVNVLALRGLSSKVYNQFNIRATPVFRQYTGKLSGILDSHLGQQPGASGDTLNNKNDHSLDYSHHQLQHLQMNKLKRDGIKYCAAIIEPSLTSTFEMSVRSVLFRLPFWPVIIFHSKENEIYVKTLLHDVDPNLEILFQLLPYSIEDIESYNKLLTSTWLWNTFLQLDFAKVLLFQSDSIMLHGYIEPYLRYDYIGAPWDLKTNKLIKNYNDKGELLEGVGNGGFSLRNVRAMLYVLNKYKVLDSINEDVYFCLYLEKMRAADVSISTDTEESSLQDASDTDTHGFSCVLPKRSVSYKFCREVEISDLSTENIELVKKSSTVFPQLTYHLPPYLALHAAWYYMEESDADELLEMSLVNF